MRKVISIVAAMLMLISSCGIIYILTEKNRYKKSISTLEDKILATPSMETPDKTEDLSKTVDFTEFLEINPDFVAWIKIDNSDISYPVMQSKEDNDFYLDHNFKKEKDPNGLPFLDERNLPDLSDDSIIIYGHNMKTGLMFHSLENYEDEKYFNDNNIISLYTKEGIRDFKIFSVLKEKIEKENSFSYNMFTNFSNTLEKNDFIKKAREQSLHINNEKIAEDSVLLTLSTCDNITMDGRIAVIAFELPNL